LHCMYVGKVCVYCYICLYDDPVLSAGSSSQLSLILFTPIFFAFHV